MKQLHQSLINVFYMLSEAVLPSPAQCRATVSLPPAAAASASASAAQRGSSTLVNTVHNLLTNCTASAATHPLVWKRQRSQVAPVLFPPILLSPSNGLYALFVCRECSTLIRSMIIPSLKGPDRSLLP